MGAHAFLRKHEIEAYGIKPIESKAGIADLSGCLACETSQSLGLRTVALSRAFGQQRLHFELAIAPVAAECFDCG